MSVRDDPHLPETIARGIGVGVRRLSETMTTRLSPGATDVDRALAEIKVLRELVYQAEQALAESGRRAHDSGATWEQVAENSGHDTASAARRYFIADPEIRRERESHDRQK